MKLKRVAQSPFYHRIGLLVMGIWLIAGPLAAQEHPIKQTDRPLIIDGKLDDWTGFEELAVDLTPDGKTLAPSADLTVKAWLSFDAEYLYVSANVVDDELVFPERGFRRGDTLFITLVDPSEKGESNRYSTYGFSLAGKQEVKFLASRGGKLNPEAFVKDIQLKILPDATKKVVIYEAAIPWRYIPDFRPFLQPTWGINLTYSDYDAKTHKTVMLVADPNVENPVSEIRKGMVFRFIPHAAAVPEFQAMLNANHYFPQDEKTVSLAVNAPASQQGWELRQILSSAAGSLPSKRSLGFDGGLHVYKFPIELGQSSSGHYDLSLGVIDPKGALRFSDDKQFFLLDRPGLEAQAAKIAEVKKSELFAKDAVFRESLPTLEVRLQWIKEFMDKAAPFADIDSLEQWDQEVRELFRYVDAGQPALFPSGRPVRLGYLSEKSGKFKSYAVLIPEWYDKKMAFPLLVTLSGGGADEERAVLQLAMAGYGPRAGRKAGDLIILSPTADASMSWYTGDAGDEVLACIAHVKKLYNVNEKAIILDGFDSGGYGALRLALLHPDVFKGVMVRSGLFIPPAAAKGEAISSLFERAKTLNILIVHGDNDQTAPIEKARKVVAGLQELKANVQFIEVKEGGHGDYDRWSEIFGWLKDVLGDAVVVTKPPKKEREKEKEKEQFQIILSW